jgi:hypothetical protein
MVGVLVVLAVAAFGEVDVADRELGFTLRLPEGFQDFPAGRAQGRAAYSYLRGAGTDRQIMVSISGLRGALPREIPLPESYPGGELSTFEVRWKREFKVPVVQIRQQVRDISMTVMTVQIPISPRALKVEVAGGATNEEEMRAILTSIVSSLDGKTNWLTRRERIDRIVQPTVGLIVVAMVIGYAIVRSRRRKSQAGSQPQS